MSKNIYKDKLEKILDKLVIDSTLDNPFKNNKKIYYVKSSTDLQLNNMQLVTNDSIKNITNSIIVLKYVDELKNVLHTMIGKHNKVVILVSKNDNLKDIIKLTKSKRVDIFSWHIGGKHDDMYFITCSNE